MQKMDGGKPIQYAGMPVFNEGTQYVVEKEPVDFGDYIFIDREVKNIDTSNDVNRENQRLQEELNEAKILKKEELSIICNKEIVSGFISTVKFDEGELYEMELENQLNMMGLMNDLALNEKMGIPNPDTIQYYPKGKPCVDYTIIEFIQLCKEATSFKTDRINKYKDLTQLVDEAVLIEQLENINW